MMASGGHASLSCPQTGLNSGQFSFHPSFLSKEHRNSMIDPWMQALWLNGIGPWWWLALGVAFLALEVMTSGFVLLWFGAGAIMSGLIFFGLHFALDKQLIIFAVLSVIALIFGRPTLLRRQRLALAQPNGLNERGSSLIGSTAVLITALENGQGRVRVADGEWSARGTQTLTEGTMVRIDAVNGNTLQVSAVEHSPSPTPRPERNEDAQDKASHSSSDTSTPTP